MNDLRLVKSKVLKNGKTYYDFNLCWLYDGKKYLCRVDPTFKVQYKLLFAMAEEVNYEDLEDMKE